MTAIKTNGDVCPNCGQPLVFEQNLPYLPAGTVLKEQYIVGKKIEEYGEGVTYIGYDIQNDRVVDIREYLPVSIIKRAKEDLSIRVKVGSEELYSNYYQSFVRMWIYLMRQRNVGGRAPVVDVLTNVNLTAYAIMPHFNGISLRDYAASLQLNGNILPWNKVRSLLVPLLDEIEMLNNSKLFHLGISPDSIFVLPNGKTYLSHFCIPQVYKADGELETSIVPGFAAIEQYASDRKCGAWTDIYSFTAVMFNLLTGLTPPAAPERINNDKLLIQQSVANALPGTVIRALFDGLKVLPQDRIDSAHKMMELLSPSESQPKPSVEPIVIDDETNGETEENEGKAKKQKKEKKEKKEPKVKKEKNNTNKKGKGAVAGLIAFICTFVVACLAYLVLYPTVCYRYVSIPWLDGVYSSIAFLPINDSVDADADADEDESSTAEQTTEEASKEMIVVADFVKLRYESVKENTYFTSNYDINVVEEYSPMPAGVIIAQSIEKNTSVPSGTKITLTVSLGASTVMLPDVMRKSYDEAYKTLTDLGFKVEKNVIENSGTSTPNEVYTMDPVAGIEYDYGTTVTLNVFGEVDAE